MSFILYLAVGMASGVLGGMGMGGGTLLIPLLTIFLGVGQHYAQAANLIAFLPMAALTLPVHKKAGYVKSDGLALIIVCAVLMSFASAALAVFLPSQLLKKLFGLFLLILAVNRILHLPCK